jgi:hypothetical protein
MRLRDLTASSNNAHAGGYFIRGGDSVDGAQGVLFQCPSCGVGKAYGCIIAELHEAITTILVYSESAHSGGVSGGRREPRWTMATTSRSDLSPSVDCTAHGHWHGWVTNGEAT